MKSIEITPPKGYEVDKKNSTFERIVFKPINTKPRNWEEYLKKDNHPDQQYFINNNGFITHTVGDGCSGDLYNVSQRMKQYLPTEEYAKAFLALMQLISLRQVWIDDWKPDWSNRSQTKFVIQFSEDKLEVDSWASLSSPLSFPTKEMAKEFLSCFQDLLEEAKELI